MRTLAIVALLALTAGARADPARFRLEWTGFSLAPTPPAGAPPIQVTLNAQGSAFQMDHPDFHLDFTPTHGQAFEGGAQGWPPAPVPLGSGTLTFLPYAPTNPSAVTPLLLSGRLTDLASNEAAEFTEVFTIGLYGSRQPEYHFFPPVLPLGGHNYQLRALERFISGENAMSVTVQTVEPPHTPEAPEPSSLLLFGVGGLGWLGWRSRRKGVS